jgi:hypothetical protein
MWILSWLPDAVFHLIFIIGVIGLIAGYTLTMIPFISKNARLIQIIAIIVTVVGVWFEGGIARDDYYQQKIAELKEKIAAAEVQSAKLNTELTQEVLRNQQLARDVASANRGRLQSQAAELNNSCRITPGVISILNDAARNSGGAK